MRKLKHIAPLAVIITGCFFYSCENKTADIKKISQKATGVEVAKDVVINYTIAGKTKAILKAPLMYRVQDTVNYIEFPQNVTTEFYNEFNFPESRLTAHYGKYTESRGLVYLRDSVKVINFLKGDTLITDEMYWDRRRNGNEFYTERPVKIRTKTQVIDGIGMEAQQDFRSYHIKQVTGVISVPNSKFPN